MCDTISALQTSLILGAFSLVPGSTSRYITLGLASASLTIYTAHHYGPTQRLARLEDTITATKEILEGAKLDCARDHITLVGRERRLLEYVRGHVHLKSTEKLYFPRAKLSASEIQTKILEARDKTWEEYFQARRW
ncbi:hypothetical protein B0H17DRAFT_1040499 [Mycena rosella]|uniref:Uncharacterized protein n=1 Tax=Mycena rosella TaxID=1033263 RepID=A0AAD7GS80_MYCRO|nr:hypothetical protein B0H17DRAFT_1040499 [Mycena rosella]